MMIQRRSPPQPKAWYALSYSFTPTQVFRLILSVLFLGPLVAPLFQASRIPFFIDSGVLVRDVLAQYICPTPAKSYVLLGFPMAVCARCWGATIGLWAAWCIMQLTLQHRTSLTVHCIQCYLQSAWLFRLLIGALPFALWYYEITLWTSAPGWALLLNGAHAGFWGGLFVASIWPGLQATNAMGRTTS